MTVSVTKSTVGPDKFAVFDIRLDESGASLQLSPWRTFSSTMGLARGANTAPNTGDKIASQRMARWSWIR